MHTATFLSSPALWEYGYGPNHPLKPERLRRTFELLNEYGAFSLPNVRLVEPRPAGDDELALFHTLDYIAIVRALSAGQPGAPAEYFRFGPGDNPPFKHMFETESLKVGSALTGAALLLDGACDVAFSYGGGLHHAGPNFAYGFCVFNDAAVVIHWLLKQGLRVAYVDIDVHHCDGVQAAFYDDPRVLTISLHQNGQTLFPGTGFVGEVGVEAGEGYTVNVPLPPYTYDEVYLWAFNQIVPPLIERFMPGIVVTQLGVDTHYRDPLAHLSLTTAGHTALFKAISALTIDHPRKPFPWLALGGGGYDVSVVPRSWTLAFGVMSGHSFSDDLPARYQARYGDQSLRDWEGPRFERGLRDRVRESVETVVAAVKQRHDLE